MTTLTSNINKLRAEVARYIAADAVIQGAYWDGSRGCFIGILAHSGDASILERLYGIPEPLARICESIFERLPADKAKSFCAAIPDAVGFDGKDLSRVHWKFLAAELRALPEVPADIQRVINPVIAGMDLLANGAEWPDAAHAARAAHAVYARAVHAAYARAAYVAYAAAHAVYAHPPYAPDAAARAASTAADAADAARAATIRQRDTLLALVREA